MQKACGFVVIVMLISSSLLVGCSSEINSSHTNENVQTNEGSESEQISDSNQEEVIALVEQFGRKLQLVSLLAPEEVVKESIKEHYRDFLSSSLLSAWINNPQLALGREVSSPWPDRIEIKAVKKTSDDVYEVSGEIIEITSVELANGGTANKRPILLLVKKIEDRWVIDDVRVDDRENNAMIHKNSEYGLGSNPS